MSLLCFNQPENFNFGLRSYACRYGRAHIHVLVCAHRDTSKPHG